MAIRFEDKPTQNTGKSKAEAKVVRSPAPPASETPESEADPELPFGKPRKPEPKAKRKTR
jgi:hypothetical protein